MREGRLWTTADRYRGRNLMRALHYLFGLKFGLAEKSGKWPFGKKRSLVTSIFGLFWAYSGRNQGTY